ncbi:MAG TPA: redoxin domain-containing protein [Pirellulales bacterium]|jgi:peroxiredoxin
MAVRFRRSLVLLAGLLSLVGLLATTHARAAAVNNERIGRAVEDFSLHDCRGPVRSLKDWQDKKLVVLAFLGTECPLANVYLPRLAELSAKWEPQGVAFVGINANQQDSITEVAAHARKMEIPFPVLKDPANEIADRLNAVRTPEVFLLDGDRVVRYWGRIDDQYGVGYQRKKAGRNDLEAAIEELLSGKSVSEPTAEAVGCLIGRVKRADPSGDVTYSNQIARLLKNRCVECHHDGQIAPFSLTSYDEAVGWAEMMKEVVHERRMPPWFAAPEHGQFKNNPSLAKEEIDLIDRWVANGCPKGNDADLPPAAEFAEGWGISQPDQIFYMRDEPYTVPAEGVVSYKHFVVDPGFTEDHWIKQAEVKAGNPAVVHHVIVFVQQRGSMDFGDPQMAYAPGMTPRRLGNGAAIRVPAGSKLVFQCHYTPNGKAQDDRSYVGFVYAKPAEVTHEVLGASCGTMSLRIPPNDGNHLVKAEHKFRRDTVLLGMNPHMHLRGKSFKYELILPDGTQETLLDVPKYDFNWQLWYMLKEPRQIPKGSRMVCTAYFDNSADNPANPNPAHTVNWGEQTWDEMMFGFYSVINPIKTSKATN